MLESVKKAFTLSGKALKLFYVMASCIVLTNIINVLVIPAPVNVEMSLGKSLLVILLTLLILLVTIFITGGALAYIKELIKTGSASLSPFVNNAKKYFLRLLGIVATIILIFIILGVALFRIIDSTQGALKASIIILMVLTFIILSVLLILSPCALVGDDVSVIEAIKRGILIGMKNFLKVFVIMLIMFLITLVVLIVASVITGLLSFILKPIANFITAIIMGIAYAALATLTNIAYMDVYLKNAYARK